MIAHEKHQRSILKGISWRVIGTLDTVLLAWLFTGNPHVALTIGGVEVFTKIFLFYLHERIWLRVPFGRNVAAPGDPSSVGTEKHYRSVVKGISWRVWGTLDTITIAFFVTGAYAKAFSIGFAEVFTKVFLYYLHERVWQRIDLGREQTTPIRPYAAATEPQPVEEPLEVPVEV